VLLRRVGGNEGLLREEIDETGDATGTGPISPPQVHSDKKGAALRKNANPVFKTMPIIPPSSLA
jgi:hypothetical protein